MAKVVVGDVVYVPFPYTDLSEVKARPALVLAGAGMRDWIVCEITSKAQKRDKDIPIARSDMQTGALKQDSFARPGRLHTLKESLFERTLGQVKNAKRAQVADAVRALF